MEQLVDDMSSRPQESLKPLLVLNIVSVAWEQRMLMLRLTVRGAAVRLACSVWEPALALSTRAASCS